MDAEQQLGSWKEIGTYLNRDARTARRWEKEEGLPVHRHSHKSRASVYAYPSEIDAWRASRKVVPEPAPARPLWKIPAFALTMALCLVMVGNGIRPIAAQGAPVARQLWAQGTYGPVSLDGRYVPYAEWAANGVGIHDLLTGTDRILHTGEVGETIVFSPDNSQIVYQYFDIKLKRYTLRLLSLQGADQKPRNLMRLDPPDYIEPLGWTPDSKEVLVVQKAADGIWQIVMVSVPNGTMRLLKSLKWGEPHARISPDGRFIAYNAPVQGQTNSDIFVLAADGSSESAVVEHPADDYGMVWSSDGLRILFLSDRTGGRSLWAAPVKDGKPTGPVELVKASFDGSLLGMARNGTLYYSVSGAERQNVYRAALDSDGRISKPPVIATDGFVNSNRGGDISPDGQSIVYYSYRPKPIVVVRNLKTGEERAVPATMPIRSIYFQGPRWFADSRSVLVVSRNNERPGDIVYRVDVVTGYAEQLLHETAGGEFVPARTGDTLYYRTFGDGGSASLRRFDLDTKRSTEIAVLKGGLIFADFSVSPDGKQIACTVNGLDPGRQTRYIAIIPATGGEPREVYHSNHVDGPSRFNALAWTPDQKYVLFEEEERAGGSAVWRVPAGGGQAEKIGLSMNARIKSPRIHPDGKNIFFTAVEADNNEVWALENFLPTLAAR